jgi:uncharacterized protein YhaN
MRIDRLDLVAYGPFTDVPLVFERVQPDIHIIYGPNEAGKSALLRAVLGLLFGIPGQTGDAFLHKASELRIGATLGEGERAIRLVRRKGNKNTLLDDDGDPLPDDPLAGFHRLVDRDRFERFFGLDHAMLRKGGEALLAGKGDVGQTLFEVSGYLGLRRILQQLEEEAAKLYKPRAQNPAVNQALAEYEAERKKNRAEAVPRERVQTLQLEIDRETVALTANRAELQETQRESARLQRIKANRPDVIRLQELRDEARTLEPVPRLAPDARSRREHQQNRIITAERQRSQLQTKIERREEEIERLPDFPLALPHEAEISELVQQTGRFRKDVADLHQRQRDLTTARELAKAAWERVFPDRPIEETQSHRPLYNDRQSVRQMIGEYGKLTAVRETCEEALANARGLSARLQEELNATCDPPDARRLEAAVKQARGCGPIETRREEALRDARLKRAAAEKQVPSLLPWHGTAEQLEILTVPLPATIDRFALKWKVVDSELADAKRRRQERATEIQECKSEIEHEVTGGRVPTRDQIAGARQNRDRLWSLIRSWVFEGVMTRERAQAHLQPGEELPGSFEAASAEADRRADLLLDNSEAAARLKAISVKLDALQQQHAALEESVGRLEAAHVQLAAEWKACWPDLECDPLPPDEMKQWIERRARVLERIEQEREHDEQAKLLTGDIERHRQAVSDAFTEIEQVAAGERETLGALLVRAEEVLRSIGESTKLRSTLRQKLEAARQTEADSQKKLDEQEKQIEAWRGKWVDLLARHNLPAESSTSMVETVLSMLDEVYGDLRTAAELRRRVDGMEHDIRAFSDKVSDLVLRIAPNLSPLRPDQAVAQLSTMLDQAKQARLTRTKYAKENTQNQDEIAELEAEVAEATKILADLREQAKCADDTELQRVEQQFEDKQNVERKMRDLETALVERNSAPVSEVVREATSVDSTLLLDNIADRQQRVAELTDAIEQAIARRERVVKELEGLDNSQASAEAAQRAQEALERVREGVEDYARLCLCMQVLRRAMESYRRKNQGPIIDRASAIFARLTLGAHSGLETDLDEHDRPVLKTIRDNGDKVPMEGLSDGTRDQLYLALRIAAIEQHVAQSAPLPVILDDVLINADDDRARASLEVLKELAGKTQVLFFTHHGRMAEIGQECGAQLVRIGRRAAAGAS